MEEYRYLIIDRAIIDTSRPSRNEPAQGPISIRDQGILSDGFESSN